MFNQAVTKLANRVFMQKFAGDLTDVSKLRYQAVFLMGAGGSGKGYAGHRWLKYMPGGGLSGVARKKWDKKQTEKITEEERGLSNLKFDQTVKALEKQGIRIELRDSASSASIPFVLWTYGPDGQAIVKPEDWEAELPPPIYSEVMGLTEVVFKTPVHELPSYWRQVNPDIYKEELSGYMESQPGYVHEMSSEMSKAYFEAVLETGDPLFVDGTGANETKLVTQFAKVRKAGYSVSLVLIFVPLTVNHIRNATRARNVPPREVTKQWGLISSNYKKLKGQADVAKVIVNRNDSKDAATYNAESKKIDTFIRKGYGGKYQNLRELIKAVSPSEVAEWDRKLDWIGERAVDPRKQRIDKLRKQKGIKPETYHDEDGTFKRRYASYDHSDAWYAMDRSSWKRAQWKEEGFQAGLILGKASHHTERSWNVLKKKINNHRHEIGFKYGSSALRAYDYGVFDGEARIQEHHDEVNSQLGYRSATSR